MSKFKINTVRDSETVRKFTFRIRDLYEKYTFEATTKAKDVLEARQKIKEKLIGWGNMVILRVADDKGTTYYGSKLYSFKDEDTTEDVINKSEFAEKVVDRNAYENMNDRCYSATTPQGYSIVETYVDNNNKIYIIAKRPEDYMIAEDYQVSDGTWKKSTNGFESIGMAQDALKKTIKNLTRIFDAGADMENVARQELNQLKAEISQKEYELQSYEKYDMQYGESKSTNKVKERLKNELKDLRNKLEEKRKLWGYVEDSDFECDKDGKNCATIGAVLNGGIQDTPIEDMSYSRADAMDRCYENGKVFIEHFDKIYKEPNSQAVNHWKKEMATRWKYVKSILLKTTNKPILDGELRDWFFTAAANPQDFMKNPTQDELEAYDKFVSRLIEGKDLYSLLPIKDCDVKDAPKSTRETGMDKIIYVMQSDADPNLYFYIGKKYSMKEGAYSYQKYEMLGTSPEELKFDLKAHGWHQVDNGPAKVIDKARANIYEILKPVLSYIKINEVPDGYEIKYEKYLTGKSVQDILQKVGYEIDTVEPGRIVVRDSKIYAPIVDSDNIKLGKKYYYIGINGKRDKYFVPVKIEESTNSLIGTMYENGESRTATLALDNFKALIRENSVRLSDAVPVDRIDNEVEQFFREGINAENSTIGEYTPWIMRLKELYNETGEEKYLEAAKAIEDIDNEEKKHVGEFSQALTNFSPEEGKLAVEGMNEVKAEDKAVCDTKWTLRKLPKPVQNYNFIIERGDGENFQVWGYYVNEESAKEGLKRANSYSNIEDCSITDSFVIRHQLGGKKYYSEFGDWVYGIENARKFKSKEEAEKKADAMQSNWKEFFTIETVKDARPLDTYIIQSYKGKKEIDAESEDDAVKKYQAMFSDVDLDEITIQKVKRIESWNHGAKLASENRDCDVKDGSRWEQLSKTYHNENITLPVIRRELKKVTKASIFREVPMSGNNYLFKMSNGDNISTKIYGGELVLQKEVHDAALTDDSVDDFCKRHNISRKELEAYAKNSNQTVQQVMKGIESDKEDFTETMQHYTYDSAPNNVNKPDIKAKGEWVWDDVKYDWYDNGRKMYYTEIVHDNEPESLTAGDVVEETTDPKESKPVEKPQPIKDGFDENKLNAWLRALEKRMVEKYPDNDLLHYKYRANYGPKYIKIIQQDDTGKKDVSVFAFADYDGNIYKAAGWNVPAKGVRATLDNPPLELGALYKRF